MGAFQGDADTFGTGGAYRIEAGAGGEAPAGPPADGPAPLPRRGAVRAVAGRRPVPGVADRSERAVTEADFLLAGTVAQLSAALRARQEEPRGGGPAAGRDTERQRVLRLEYRELVERLLGT